MTSPISPVTDQSQGGTTNTSSLGTAGLLDPSTFLSLLVDELKYQNPLDPTSSSDFMSQIASTVTGGAALSRCRRPRRWTKRRGSSARP